jgi:4'-phosphopantetheinyl transferase
MTTDLTICGVWDASLNSPPKELPVGSVHLWQRTLENSAADLDDCYALLNSAEREKAARYRVEQPRSDYVLTRGTLRSLLAKYLQQDPSEISFRYTKHEKPYLAGVTDLRFNVSHSDGLALLGFTRTREIGVDVEKIRPQVDVRQLTERFFSLQERAAMRDLSGDDLHTAFFRCWTRKESYIKASGEGLSLPLHQFDVSIEEDPKQALLGTRPDAAEVYRWSIRNVSVRDGYAAAVCVAAS